MNRIAVINRLNSSGLYTKASDSVINGVSAILDGWEKSGLTDPRWLAYMLATAYHETGYKMQPVEEIGRGKTLPYGQKLKYGGGPGKRVAYTTPDKIYYGRGLVQITWYELYEKFGKVLNIDLLNNPELALSTSVSVDIMIKGMTQGLFTGRRLDQYFNKDKEDAVNARRIINGLDCAEKIAGHYTKFLYCVS